MSFGIGGALAAPDALAVPSDRNRRLFHRHVEADIFFHGCSPFDAWARRPVVSPYFHLIGEQPPASMCVTASGRLAPAITPCGWPPHRGLIGALAPCGALQAASCAKLAQLGQLGLVLIVGLFVGALPAAMVECAPPGVRCTAVALGYNVTLGVIGGLTPLVAAWLVERTGDELAPAFLIMATAVISFLVIPLAAA